MKKAIITGALILAVLFVTIVPVFAETVNASEYENMAYISPIIYILQNNGFEVNYDDAFGNYQGTNHGILTFTGHIEANTIYKSSMTLKTFIDNYAAYTIQQERQRENQRTNYYWLNIESDNLTVNLWANETILTQHQLLEWEQTFTGDETLGISFSNIPENNTDTTEHQIKNITVIKTNDITDLTIENDITPANWPFSKDYYKGYLFQNPGTKIITPDYKEGNIFALATTMYVRVDYKRPGTGGTTETRTQIYNLNENDLILGGISLSRIDLIVRQRMMDNFDAGERAVSAIIYIEWPSEKNSFTWDTITLWRSGSAAVNTIRITAFYPTNRTYIATPITNSNFAQFEINLENNESIIKPVVVKKLQMNFNLNYNGYYEGQDPIAPGTLDMSLQTTNETFNQGWTQGHAQGWEEGKKSGYEQGNKIGRQIGYEEGYQEGLQREQPTFYDLMFAVVDAPVQVFGSMFNFEILGVNMRAFLLGLLTLAIFVIVIKKVVL